MNSDGLLLVFVGVLVVLQVTAGGAIDRVSAMTKPRTA